MSRSKHDVELELKELQRKYRILEGDRRAYQEESQTTIRRQETTLEKLEADNEHLRVGLGGRDRGRSSREYRAGQRKVSALQDKVDGMMRQVDTETVKIERLQKQIRVGRQSLKERQASTGGVYGSRETASAVQKQIRVLENRLDKALVKFNAALSTNRRLREEIDGLRQERVVFDGIYKKLERELQQKKSEMATIIEISNVAYEERDQAQSELAALRQQQEKDDQYYEEEFRKLDRQLESDRRMKEFLKVKERGRSHTSPERSSERGDARRAGTKGKWAHAKDRAASQHASEKAHDYEEAFEKIREATGIDDIGELVNKFIQAEDQNFSLFNYVNELNNEVERLEEQVAEIRAETERYKGQGANTDIQRKKILKDLEERLARTEAKAEQYEAKHDEAVKILDELKVGIQSVFDKIGCNAESMSEMLGDQGVTEGNMMQYLGVIEQRTNELFQMLSVVEEKEREDAHEPEAPLLGSPVLRGPSAPRGAQQLTIVPPSTGDDMEEEDSEFEDEDRPFTREELKARQKRIMAKREKSSLRRSRTRGGVRRSQD